MTSGETISNFGPAGRASLTEEAHVSLPLSPEKTGEVDLPKEAYGKLMDFLEEIAKWAETGTLTLEQQRTTEQIFSQAKTLASLGRKLFKQEIPATEPQEPIPTTLPQDVLPTLPRFGNPALDLRENMVKMFEGAKTDESPVSSEAVITLGTPENRSKKVDPLSQELSTFMEEHAGLSEEIEKAIEQYEKGITAELVNLRQDDSLYNPLATLISFRDRIFLQNNQKIRHIRTDLLVLAAWNQDHMKGKNESAPPLRIAMNIPESFGHRRDYFVKPQELTSHIADRFIEVMQKVNDRIRAEQSGVPLLTFRKIAPEPTSHTLGSGAYTVEVGINLTVLNSLKQKTEVSEATTQQVGESSRESSYQLLKAVPTVNLGESSNGQNSALFAPTVKENPIPQEKITAEDIEKKEYENFRDLLSDLDNLGEGVIATQIEETGSEHITGEMVAKRLRKAWNEMNFAYDENEFNKPPVEQIISDQLALFEIPRSRGLFTKSVKCLERHPALVNLLTIKDDIEYKAITTIDGLIRNLKSVGKNFRLETESESVNAEAIGEKLDIIKNEVEQGKWQSQVQLSTESTIEWRFVEMIAKNGIPNEYSMRTRAAHLLRQLAVSRISQT